MYKTMYKTIYKKLLCTLLVSVGIFLPALAFGSDIASLAANLLGPTVLITQFLVYACYIVGVIFCFMAIAQYTVHRESPKLVPLSTPVMLVLFGILLILLPYLSTLFNTGSALEYSKKAGIVEQGHKGLALPPLERAPREGPGDFSRKSREERARSSDQVEPSRSTPPSPDRPDRPELVPEGGAHWSDEPQYR